MNDRGFGRARLAEWCLDPDGVYLNHGTVGAVPRRVLEAQQRWRDRIEVHPSRFMLRDLRPMTGGNGSAGLLRGAAAEVARFLHAAPDDVVFVDNVSTGLNAILRSLTFGPGDEILLLDHAYGATLLAAQFVTRASDAQVRTVEVPFPAFDAEELLRRVTAAISPRTRLFLTDHVTSETALVLPLSALAAAARARGVRVAVDGAHAPGVVALDVPALGVDFYTANLHKWAHAPRSCGFLWTASEHHAAMHPPVISWGLDAGYLAEFDWVGTRDPSPFLAAPEGLAVLADLGQAGRDWNHALAVRASRELPAAWGTTFEAGEDTIGAMVSLPAPTTLGATREDAAVLRDWLLFAKKIEVHTAARGGRLWIRVCAQVYNEWTDFEQLRDAILERMTP